MGGARILVNLILKIGMTRDPCHTLTAMIGSGSQHGCLQLLDVPAVDENTLEAGRVETNARSSSYWLTLVLHKSRHGAIRRAGIEDRVAHNKVKTQERAKCNASRNNVADLFRAVICSTAPASLTDPHQQHRFRYLPAGCTVLTGHSSRAKMCGIAQWQMTALHMLLRPKNHTRQ